MIDGFRLMDNVSDVVNKELGNQDTDKHYRLESLKLAYEVAFKVNSITPSRTPEQIYDAIVGVLDIAEINFKYIKSGSPLTI
jgi:hypothetical protein